MPDADEADFARRLAERATATPELEAPLKPSERVHPAFGQAIIPLRPW